MSRLPADIPVTGFFPFLNYEEDFTLTAGSDYDKIVATLCKDIAVNSSNVSLSRIDKMGWHTSIVKDQSRLGIQLGINDLEANDRIAISKQRDNVGPRMYMKSLEVYYSDSSRVSDLMNRYCGWRSIKGDGNCYYRAVYCSLFEQIIVGEKCYLFAKLHDEFATLHFTDEVDQEEHEEFLWILAQEAPAWTSVAQFEYEILNSDSIFDEACVRACRHLLSQYILKNQDVVLNGSGITIRDAIQPSYTDVRLVNVFVI